MTRLPFPNNTVEDQRLLGCLGLSSRIHGANRSLILSVITDFEDPKFDLEAFLLAKAKENP